MNITVDDLMTERVMTGTPGQTVGQVRDVMNRNGIHTLPIVNPEGEPIGVVSASDLIAAKSDATPVRNVMTEKVHCIPRYSGVHIAARMMRNSHVHRLVVTHEPRVVGIISSYDLLRLVEDHRFVMKNPPTSSRKRGIVDMGAELDQ